MKFEFNWSSGFWEKYVLIYWWDSDVRENDWNVKSQPWPLEPINRHCLIRFDIMTLASTVLKKIYFYSIFPIYI